MSRREDVRIVVECDRCGDQINHCYECGASHFRPGDAVDEDPYVYTLNGQDLCESCYRPTCHSHHWRVGGTGTGGAYCTVCRIRADVTVTPQTAGGAS